MDGATALELLEGVRTLKVAKGRKILTFDLENDRPGDEEILAEILGRSGTLRAPALRAGDTFMVGYNDDILAEVFGD